MTPPGLPGTVTVHDDPAQVAAAAADWVLDIAAAAIAAGGRFRIALAGGNTPRGLYRLLAAAPRRDATDWSGWEVFFGDERACPPDDPSSNYRMAREALLDLVPIARGADPPDGGGARRPRRRGRPVWDDPVLNLPGRYPRVPSPAGLHPARAGRERSHRLALPRRPVARGRATGGRCTAGPTTPRTTGSRSPSRCSTPPPTSPSWSPVPPRREALRGVIQGTVPAARVRPADGELRWFLDAAAAAA